MANFVLAVDLFGFVQIAKRDLFGWPTGSREADEIRSMQPGDRLVVKLAQSPTFETAGGGRVGVQSAYCRAVGLDYDEMCADYEETVRGGEAAVPWVLQVVGHPRDVSVAGQTWVQIPVRREPLEHPLSTSDFLRLRAVPWEIAAQFKGMVSRGRHVQRVSPDMVDGVARAGRLEDRSGEMRQLSLVRATDVDSAVQALVRAARGPRPGDRVFIFEPDRVLGIHDADDAGRLIARDQPLTVGLAELRTLLQDAHAKRIKQDGFTAGPGLRAYEQLAAMLERGPDVESGVPVNHFHDRFVLFSSRITAAIAIAQRPTGPGPSSPEPVTDSSEATAEDEAVLLHGLTVRAVRAELEGIELPDSVIAEAVTALRAGKHLLLSGPPGTGKSTLAEAICRAVVGEAHDVATATADWTTFDTIGGYLPNERGLSFEPGVVLRSLRAGRWLVIDELNRADIDKAFGPLFTLLAGTHADRPGRRVVLPFQESGRPVEISWQSTIEEADEGYFVTPTWRLIGTLNVSDKASLFQLSFAFLRRFAIIDVPIPTGDRYAAWLRPLLHNVGQAQRDAIVSSAIGLAQVTGRELGPAILSDMAAFITTGLTEAATGETAYSSPWEAYVTAVRLFAVPQYEGATAKECKSAMDVVTQATPAELGSALKGLEAAFKSVALN